jgi:hypothetical protein
VRNDTLPLEGILAANLRHLRGNRTQDEIAARARRLGLQWTRATIAALETKRRKLSLGEALLAQAVYCRPLADLLGCRETEVVDVDGVEIGGGTLRALASGEWETVGERLQEQTLADGFMAWAAEQGRDPAEVLKDLGDLIGVRVATKKKGAK